MGFSQQPGTDAAIQRFWGRRPGAVLAFTLALALLTLACASLAAPAAEPPSPPDAVETPVATPEVSLPAPAPTPEVEEHAAQAMASLSGPVAGSATAPFVQEDSCEDRPLEPLPLGRPPFNLGFWEGFRAPLPPAPVWNPPGPKRVGLQAGHWRSQEVPQELSGLVGGGTSGGGRAEWEVNLDLAQRAAAILEGYGVAVDIIPTTIPPRYRAHAFVAIHADGDLSGALRGYKVARAGFSAIPETDDALVQSLYEQYGAATGLPRDDLHVSRRMVYYYAFNSRRYCHALAPGVPAAIIETGFLTSAVDRQLLLGAPDRAAEGIAREVLRFLGLLEPQSGG